MGRGYLSVTRVIAIRSITRQPNNTWSCGRHLRVCQSDSAAVEDISAQGVPATHPTGHGEEHLRPALANTVEPRPDRLPARRTNYFVRTRGAGPLPDQPVALNRSGHRRPDPPMRTPHANPKIHIDVTKFANTRDGGGHHSSLWSKARRTAWPHPTRPENVYRIRAQRGRRPRPHRLSRDPR